MRRQWKNEIVRQWLPLLSTPDSFRTTRRRNVFHFSWSLVQHSLWGWCALICIKFFATQLWFENTRNYILSKQHTFGLASKFQVCKFAFPVQIFHPEPFTACFVKVNTWIIFNDYADQYCEVPLELWSATGVEQQLTAVGLKTLEPQIKCLPCVTSWGSCAPWSCPQVLARKAHFS